MFSISWTHCPQGQCWRNLHSDSSFCHRCDTPHVLLNPSIADWYVPLGPMAKSENTPSHSTLHINIRELSDLICRSLNDSVAIGFATRILYATRTSAIVLLGSLLKAEQRRTISPHRQPRFASITWMDFSFELNIPWVRFIIKAILIDTHRIRALTHGTTSFTSKHAIDSITKQIQSYDLSIVSNLHHGWNTPHDGQSHASNRRNRYQHISKILPSLTVLELLDS